MSDDLDDQTLIGVPPGLEDWAAEKRLAEKRARALTDLLVTAPVPKPRRRRRVNPGYMVAVAVLTVFWSLVLVSIFR